jgi:hypothetical protein
MVAAVVTVLLAIAIGIPMLVIGVNAVVPLLVTCGGLGVAIALGGRRA